MDKAALLALAERVEALTGADQEVDEMIADALFERSHFAQLSDAPLGTGCMMWWQDGHQQSALRYTASLDAAMTLVPEGWHCDGLKWWEGEPADCKLIGSRWTGRDWVHHFNDGRVQAHGVTAAIALTAASLRARAAEGKK